MSSSCSQTTTPRLATPKLITRGNLERCACVVWAWHMSPLQPRLGIVAFACCFYSSWNLNQQKYNIFLLGYGEEARTVDFCWLLVFEEEAANPFTWKRSKGLRMLQTYCLIEGLLSCPQSNLFSVIVINGILCQRKKLIFWQKYITKSWHCH